MIGNLGLVMTKLRYLAQPENGKLHRAEPICVWKCISTRMLCSGWSNHDFKALNNNRIHRQSQKQLIIAQI